MRRTALVGAVLAALVAATSWYEVTHTKVVTLYQTSARITGRELRVMQVSDLHDVQFTTQRDELIGQIAAQHPDAVALTGDLVNMYTTDLTRMDAWLTRLDALHLPVFFVPGNHDHHDGHLPAVLEMLGRHRVTVLQNRTVAFDGPWGRVDVVGTDDYYSGFGDLPSAMANTRSGTFRLVLTHSPQAFDDIAAADVDLAICGHTHGGQVRIPGIGAVETPGGGWFPRLDRGSFPAGRATLYIDSGVGQSVPLRLFDQSQMTLVTIARA